MTESRAIPIKRDLASAFRNIPIAPEDCQIVGFYEGNEYYAGSFLLFGPRTPPLLFGRFVTYFLAEAAPEIHQNFPAAHYLG